MSGVSVLELCLAGSQWEFYETELQGTGSGTKFQHFAPDTAVMGGSEGLQTSA